MNKIEFDKINIILSEWNPIGVPKEVSITEYSSYISKILSYRNDFLGLVKHIELILINDLEYDYNENNIEEKSEILIVAYKIYKVINGSKV